MRRLSDAPFKESDANGTHLRKRFTGWYDRSIVTREGEDILSKLDDYAAKCFFERGYTYRKRRSALDIHHIGGGFVAGRIYTVNAVDARRLRLFGLSLLWRLAVSTLDAASSVSMSPKHVRDIAARIMGAPDNISEFPVYFAIASDGNELSKMQPFRVGQHPFIRFFLDGVVCYASPWRRRAELSAYSALTAGRFSDQIDMWCFDSVGGSHAQYEEEVARKILARHGNPFEKTRRSTAR